MSVDASPKPEPPRNRAERRHPDATPSHLQRLAYSPAELADALGASRAWVYLRLDDGTIPSVKLGGKRLIRASVLEELLASDEVAS